MLVSLLVSTLLPLLAAAAEAPPTTCLAGEAGCSAPMTAYARAFATARAPGEAARGPLLASGPCYHRTPDYNGETTHYGAVLLDPHEGALYMGDRFAFFFPENPYSTFTVERFRAEAPNLYIDQHRVELSDQFAYSARTRGSETIMQYWLRRSDEHLYVIGQWGRDYTVFCELAFQ